MKESPYAMRSGFAPLPLHCGKRYGAGPAALRYPFEERPADYNIMFSPESARVQQRMDGVNMSRMTSIGVPEYDDIFERVSPGNSTSGSLLLIDSPNAENRWNSITTSKEEKARFLAMRDANAARLVLPLRMTLHPETCGANWLPELPNTTYVEDGDITAELEASAPCVGFDSVLMVPAVWLRLAILIRLRPLWMVDVARHLGAAVVVDIPMMSTSTCCVKPRPALGSGWMSAAAS
jgi:hypothetical protein